MRYDGPRRSYRLAVLPRINMDVILDFETFEPNRDGPKDDDYSPVTDEEESNDEFDPACDGLSQFDLTDANSSRSTPNSKSNLDDPT